MAGTRELSAAGKRRLAERNARRERTSAHGHMYFVQSHDTHLIKIGYSTNLEKRLRDISAHHSKLTLLYEFYCRGPKKYERLIQTLFQDLCVRGEWFRSNGRIWDFIEARERSAVKVDKWLFNAVKEKNPRILRALADTVKTPTRKSPAVLVIPKQDAKNDTRESFAKAISTSLAKNRLRKQQRAQNAPWPAPRTVRNDK